MSVTDFTDQISFKMHSDMDDIKDTASFLDECIESVTEEVPELADVSFELTKASKRGILCFHPDEGLDQTFTLSGDGYTLVLTLRYIFDDDDYTAEYALYHMFGGRLEAFRDDEWVMNDALQKFYDTYTKNKYWAGLLSAMCDNAGGLDENAAVKFIRRNNRLVNLCETLGGCGAMDMICPDGPDTPVAAIVPAMYPHYGIAVTFDNGMFRFWCRHDREADKAAGMPSGWLRSLEYVVFSTGDFSKAMGALKFFLDRYTDSDPVFTYPLSASAYATSRDPYRRLKTVTRYGQRDLNPRESEALDRLYEFFGIRTHPLG